MMRLLFILLIAAPALANSDFEGGAAAIAQQPDGRIVVVGSSSVPDWMDKVAVARFLPDGTLDSTFGSGGKVLLDLSPHCDTARAVAIDAAGRIVFAGTRNYTNGCPRPSEDSEGYIGRLNADGTVDTGFGTNGYVALAWPKQCVDITGLVLPPGGGVVFAGHHGPSQSSAFGTHFVGRVTDAGMPDATFGQSGLVESTICAGNAKCESMVKALELSADGSRLYLGGAKFIGNITYYAEAYGLDGAPIAGYGAGGRAEVAIGGYGRGAEAMALTRKGEIYLGGSGNRRGNKAVTIVKLDAAGALDTGFAEHGRLQLSLHEDIHQLRRLRYANGRLNVLATLFCIQSTCPPGMPRGTFLGLTRLTPTGKTDATFGDHGRRLLAIGGHTLAGDLLAYPRGELLIAGDAYVDKKLGSFGLARLDGLGNGDATFGQAGIVGLPVF